MNQKEKNFDEEIKNSSDTSEDNVNNTEEINDNETVTDTVENAEPTDLEKAQSEAKANYDKYLRTYAEFDNFRKRTIAEKAGMYDNGTRDTIEKLLPIIDNFERAVDSAPDKNDTFYTGVEMILKQFKEILSSMKVEEISEAGITFDPNIHNAVMHIEDDSMDENVVVDILQKGYSLNGKVIRPAMVRVAN